MCFPTSLVRLQGEEQGLVSGVALATGAEKPAASAVPLTSKLQNEDSQAHECGFLQSPFVQK